MSAVYRTKLNIAIAALTALAHDAPEDEKAAIAGMIASLQAIASRSAS